VSADEIQTQAINQDTAVKRKTQAERDHLEAVAALPCCVSGKYGVHVHHLPTQGGRKNHFRTIPLSPYHHTDGPYGEAVHQGRKAFEQRYGTEESLWIKTNRILGIL